MGRHSRLSKSRDDPAEIGSHVLKDEREADDIRRVFAYARQNLRGIGPIGHDERLVPRGVYCGHEIAQTEVVLVLKTDQEHLLRATVWIACGYLHRSGWQYSHVDTSSKAESPSSAAAMPGFDSYPCRFAFSNCCLTIVSIESRRAFSALMVCSVDSSWETDNLLKSNGGGSPTWPMRPSVVAETAGRVKTPPNGPGST